MRGEREKREGRGEEEVKEQISRVVCNSSSLTGGAEVGGGLEEGADCCSPEKLIPS